MMSYKMNTFYSYNEKNMLGWKEREARRYSKDLVTVIFILQILLPWMLALTLASKVKFDYFFLNFSNCNLVV